MSTQPINTLFRYNNTVIDIDQLPRISDSAIRVFSDLGHQPPQSVSPIPPAFKEQMQQTLIPGKIVITGKNLEERIQILNTTIQKLEQAQKNSKEDKIIALAKMVILVTISVAGMLFLPFPIRILAPLISYMLFGAVHGGLLYQEHLENRNLAKFRPIDYNDAPYPRVADNDPAFPYCGLGAFLAPLVPIFQAFSRVSSLKMVVETQKDTIQTIKDSAEKGFHETLDYFRDHGEKLSQKIEARIQKLKSDQEKITAFQNQQQISVTGDGIGIKLSALLAAEKELTPARSFYAQYRYTSV
jgi:hypothetical protein